VSKPWIKHGKRRGYQQGCRLPCCVEAEKAYNRKRRRLRGHGEGPELLLRVLTGERSWARIEIKPAPVAQV
jgi:hypothetical protein